MEVGDREATCLAHKWQVAVPVAVRLQHGHRAPSNRHGHPINCCPRSVSDGNQLKLKLVKSLTYLRVCVQVAHGYDGGVEQLVVPVVFGAFSGNKRPRSIYAFVFVEWPAPSNFGILEFKYANGQLKRLIV